MSNFWVGLTGGVGSGKSTVAALFAKRGVVVVDADDIARQLTTSDDEVLAELRAALGDWAFDAQGRFDRRAVRERVWKDEKIKDALENCLHPRIRATMREQLRAASSIYAIGVVPLLLEKDGWRGLFHRVLVVDCDDATRFARVRERDGINDARAISRYQLPADQRRARADDIISNDRAVEDLHYSIRLYHAGYKIAADYVFDDFEDV